MSNKSQTSETERHLDAAEDPTYHMRDIKKDGVEEEEENEQLMRQVCAEPILFKDGHNRKDETTPSENGGDCNTERKLKNEDSVDSKFDDEDKREVVEGYINDSGVDTDQEGHRQMTHDTAHRHRNPEESAYGRNLKRNSEYVKSSTENKSRRLKGGPITRTTGSHNRTTTHPGAAMSPSYHRQWTRKLKLHVTFRESKKIVLVGWKEDEAPVDCVMEAVRERFALRGFQSVTLQYFHKEFQDWVDLEEGDVVKTMTKLNVVLSSLPVVDRLNSPTPSTSAIAHLLPRPNELESNPLLVPERVGKHERLSFDRPCDMGADGMLPDRVLEPWPVPFAFPSYALRAGVELKMYRGEKLTRAELSNVTNAVYQEVTKYTYYPKEYQYTQVVTALLDKYPTLRHSEGTPQDSFSVWRKRIQYRFQNDRRRKDGGIPGKRKRGNVEACDEPLANKHLKIIWNIPGCQKEEEEDV